MPDDVVPPLPEARRRVALAEGSGDPAAVAGAVAVLGAALFETHQVALALEAFERAEGLYAEVGDEGAVASSRLNRALCLSGLGRADEAVALYEGLAGSPTHGAHALQALGLHHDRRDEVDRADAAYGRMRAWVAEHSRAHLPEHDFGAADRLLDLGRHEEAAAAFALLAPVFDGLGQPERAGDCEVRRGVAHHRAGEAHQAEDAYVKAMSAYTVAGATESLAATRHNLDILRGRPAADR